MHEALIAKHAAQTYVEQHGLGRWFWDCSM